MEDKKIYCVYCGKEALASDTRCGSCGKRLDVSEHLLRDFLIEHTKDEIKGNVEDSIYETIKNWLLSHLYGVLVSVTLLSVGVTTFTRSNTTQIETVNSQPTWISQTSQMGEIVTSDTSGVVTVSIDDNQTAYVSFSDFDPYILENFTQAEVNQNYLIDVEAVDGKVTYMDDIPVIYVLDTSGLLQIVIPNDNYTTRSGNTISLTPYTNLVVGQGFEKIRKDGDTIIATDTYGIETDVNNLTRKLLDSILPQAHFNSLAEWLASDSFQDFIQAQNSYIYQQMTFADENGRLIINISNMGKMDDQDLISNSQSAYDSALRIAQSMYAEYTKVTDLKDLVIKLNYYESDMQYFIEDVTFTFPQ